MNIKHARKLLFPTLRFWTWTDSGWVKLSLRPGQSLTHHKGGPTDEGYSWESDTWAYSATDDDKPAVLNSFGSGGRDCDGGHGTSGALIADLDTLCMFASYDCGTPACYHDGKRIQRPDWRKEREVRVYDQYAQAAGY